MSLTNRAHTSEVMKHCPSSGNSGFSSEGEKLFSFGNCGFNCCINPAPAVAVIIKAPDGRIFLTS